MNNKKDDNIFIIDENPNQIDGQGKLNLQSALNKYFGPSVRVVKNFYSINSLFDEKINNIKKERSQLNGLSACGKTLFSIVSGFAVSVYLFNNRIIQVQNPTGLACVCMLASFGLVEAITLPIKASRMSKRKKAKIEKIEKFRKEFNEEKQLFDLLVQNMDFIIKNQNVSAGSSIETYTRARNDMNTILFRLIDKVYGENLTPQLKELVNKYNNLKVCNNLNEIIADLKVLREQTKNIKFSDFDVPNLFDKKENYMIQCARRSFVDNLGTIATFAQVTNSIYFNIKQKYDKQQQEIKLDNEIKKAKESAVFEEFLKEYGIE